MISTCPAFIASNIVLSGISSAPASIIAIFSIVPATVNVNLLFFLSSSVGLITILSLTYPTATAAVGPPKGISDIESAADAPIIAHISGEQSCSTDNTKQSITTSFLKSFGNNGLIGLSIALDVKIAFSDGFPSLFVNPPGIFPTAYNFSLYSTESGKKSIPSFGSFEAVALTNTVVSPYFTKTLPLASPAIFPVSKTSGLPANSIL